MLRILAGILLGLLIVWNVQVANFVYKFSTSAPPSPYNVPQFVASLETIKHHLNCGEPVYAYFGAGPGEDEFGTQARASILSGYALSPCPAMWLGSERLKIEPGYHILNREHIDFPSVGSTLPGTRELLRDSVFVLLYVDSP